MNKRIKNNGWPQVGFNRGDGSTSHTHALSLYHGIQYIYEETNVDVRGRWMYRVDGLDVIYPGACEQTSIPIPGRLHDKNIPH